MFLPLNQSSWLSSILLVFISSLNFGKGLCPMDCYCDESDLSVTCESPSNLQVVPISLNPDVLELNISGTPIKQLDAAFQFYGELRRLDLSFNKISTLEDRCFENQVKLVRLDLAYNSLSSLQSAKVFYPLPELEYLNLEGNQIVNISIGVLGYLQKLKYLNLKANRIMVLPLKTFDGIIASLREINLSFNFIRALELNDLMGLGTLDLSSNPLHSFDGLPLNLRELFLANTNNISSSSLNSMFASLRDLRYLDISSNLFQKGELKDLYSDSLFKLVLRNNSNLFHMDIDASLSQMIRLRSLEIRHQPNLEKVTIDLRHFGKLRYLDISDNHKLSSIDFSNRRPTPSQKEEEEIISSPHHQLVSRLRELRLVNNHLSIFQPGDISQVDSLEDIFLDGNPLLCDCHLRWIQNFLKLKGGSVKRDMEVSCSSLPRNLSSIPQEELYCRDKEFELWVVLGLLLTLGSFCLLSFLLLYTRRNRLNNKKKIVDANATTIAEDIGTMAGTWRSKSTGMTFLDQNEFIYATPNNNDRIIPTVQERNNDIPDYYYYGGGTLPNRYFIQQQRHSNHEEDEIFYLP
ncbi:uncharacterized protein [Lepeophtheirus salmonis]|uniref:uncharacterized protein n=1 Tax=Lepeophtheirus salmonis TaxID=72036 RepID=UPI001AE34831|nr:chaoptin-like [Lepeophtheirus salmonis]